MKNDILARTLEVGSEDTVISDLDSTLKLLHVRSLSPDFASSFPLWQVQVEQVRADAVVYFCKLGFAEELGSLEPEHLLIKERREQFLEKLATMLSCHTQEEQLPYDVVMAAAKLLSKLQAHVVDSAGSFSGDVAMQLKPVFERVLHVLHGDDRASWANIARLMDGAIHAASIVRQYYALASDPLSRPVADHDRAWLTKIQSELSVLQERLTKATRVASDHGVDILINELKGIIAQDCPTHFQQLKQIIDDKLDEPIHDQATPPQAMHAAYKGSPSGDDWHATVVEDFKVTCEAAKRSILNFDPVKMCTRTKELKDRMIELGAFITGFQHKLGETERTWREATQKMETRANATVTEGCMLSLMSLMMKYDGKDKNKLQTQLRSEKALAIKAEFWENVHEHIRAWLEKGLNLQRIDRNTGK